ncbi:telomerase protein component 1-like [Liolophura sinensis]|uniref:telomerase protein component 1-like n=1 Tax=Liolophura sinensis TaxID=3198878 RepID=UPI0031593185
MEKGMEKLNMGSLTTGEAPYPLQTKVSSITPGEAPSSWKSVNIDKLLTDEGYDETSADEFYWWNVVDKLNTQTPMAVIPDTKRKTWKTIRLFVSSTFKDMNSEREHLVKQIFPQLRQWCEGRKLRLIECDLRWGIPKDSDTSKTLIGCLSQIDRCREENECPYFLCMLSERYGWCPQPTEVPDHIKTRYKWMPGISVTSLEILTGAYWDHNPNVSVEVFLEGQNCKNQGIPVTGFGNRHISSKCYGTTVR